MKKVLLLVVISIVCTMSFACGNGQNETATKLEDMDAGVIFEALNTQGYPNNSASYYTEKDPSRSYPWSIKGCTSAVVWGITTSTEGGESIGIIEVFNSKENCTERVLAVMPPDVNEQKYFVQEGNVLVQIPIIISEEGVDEFKAALKALADGKIPEPYTGT